jgi:hypothetical protein
MGLNTSSSLRGRFCPQLLGTTCCSGRTGTLGRRTALYLLQGSVSNWMKRSMLHAFLPLSLGFWKQRLGSWVSFKPSQF